MLQNRRYLNLLTLHRQHTLRQVMRNILFGLSLMCAVVLLHRSLWLIHLLSQIQIELPNLMLMPTLGYIWISLRINSEYPRL